MDITNFTKQQGLFLKAADVIKSQTKIFTIVSEGKMAHNEKYGSERLHLTGEMDTTSFVFDCSKTNARTIEAVLGTDTMKWIGTQILLEVYKTKTTDGKMIDAINVAKVIIQ